MEKDNIFKQKKTLNLRGKINQLSSPMVMGIINLSGDSFYDGGKYSNSLQVLKQTENLLNNGAQIIDLGAASSRPGADIIDSESERLKLRPVIRILLKHFPDTVFSIDTYNSQTALMALDEGAHIINDISAGQIDSEILHVVAKRQAPYVLTHMKGIPKTMQQNPQYEDVVREVAAFFAQKIFELNQLGVNDIILDPGFGFGKTLEQNYQLLAQLSYFEVFELPILAGLSRKSMISRVLNIGPEQALNGTTVLNTIALLKGATILRVHDAHEAWEAIKITQMFKKF